MAMVIVHAYSPSISLTGFVPAVVSLLIFEMIPNLILWLLALPVPTPSRQVPIALNFML